MSQTAARVRGLDGLLRWSLAVAGLAVLVGTAAAIAHLLPFTLSAVPAWLSIQAAAVCGILAVGLRGPWRRSALVAASLWAGVSAQLAMTQPLWFQFLRVRPSAAYEVGLWGLVAAQALVAAAVLLAMGGPGAAGAFVRRMGAGRVGLLLLLLFAACAGAGRQVADHNYFELAKQFVGSGLLLAIDLASLIALAASLPGTPLAAAAERLGRLVSLPGQADALRPLDRWVPWIAAAWTLAASAAVCVIAFGRAPRVADEVSYLFHARYLAQGVLSLPAPPEAARAALAYDFLMIRDGRWFSILAPGWPAVLAIGARLGAPWLVNPVLGAASVLLAHTAAARLSSRGSANLVAVLMAVSPWLIAMSATLMTHTVTLAAALAAVVLLILARDGRTWAALLAGAAMGLIFLTRPMDGLVAGVLAGLWTLTFLGRPRGWLVVLAYGLGCILVGALIFPYNAQLVGDPLLPPLQLYQDQLWGPGSNRLGFGSDIGPPNQWHGLDLYRGHSPFEALLLTQLSVYGLSWELLGWPALSLGLVFAWIVWGRRSRLELAMAGSVVALVLILALYWYTDVFYVGPRYMFLAFAPLIVLSAAGAGALVQRLSTAGAPQAGARLGAGILVMSLFSVVAFLPWRAATRYYDHRDFHPAYRSVASDLHGGLVFVASPMENDIASALALNSPFLEPDRTLFLRDLGPASRDSIARAFPGRPLYVTAGRGKDGSAPKLAPYAPGR